MTSHLIELGELLDAWAADDRAVTTETVDSLTIARLNHLDALEIRRRSDVLTSPCEICDVEGEVYTGIDFDAALAPFIATFKKPQAGADVRLITKKGFSDFLSASKIEGICQLTFAETTFTTGVASFNPVGKADLFSPSAPTKSPVDLVRETGNEKLAPKDIRELVLRNELSEALWVDPAFVVFVHFSAPQLVRAIASEVVDQNTIAFSGPPRAVWRLDAAVLVSELGLAGYRNLQMAANWIYEDSKTAEQRHSLFASELAMSASRTDVIGRAFAAMGSDILDGARLAFQLSQSELVRETIKAQGDLRKSIVDDVTKAADTCRSLIGATTVAIATGMSLVAARVVSGTEPWIFSIVAIIVSIYLCVVAISGWAQLNVQRALREQWRKRIYRFIPDEDYSAMVIKPTADAEMPYNFVGAASLLVCALLIYMAVYGFNQIQKPTILAQPNKSLEQMKTAADPKAGELLKSKASELLKGKDSDPSLAKN